MKIRFAESLRFPGVGNSAQGKPVPKTRPKGVVDGQQVNIPAPHVDTEVGTLPKGPSGDWKRPSRKGDGIYDSEAVWLAAKKSHVGFKQQRPY